MKTIVMGQPCIPIPMAIAKPITLTANQRLHWATRARSVRQLRSIAFYAARGARFPQLERASLKIEIEWPDQRRRDRHNLMPTLKALIDGLVDAKVLPDDDDKHLVGPELVTSPQLCDSRLGCFLSFTFTPMEVAK